MNQYLNLPVPSSTGAGAAVDTSKMGATKTVVVGGSIKGSVVIEYANDAAGAGPWAELPNGAFQNPGRVTIDVAARWMRARTDGTTVSANADVGSSSSGGTFLQIGAAPVDISSIPAFKTVVAPSACNVEVSEDGVSWSQAFSFQGEGGQSQIVIGLLARCLQATVEMGGALTDDLDDGFQPFPAGFPVIDLIYVRASGNDISGNGTLANPYRTVQRANLDLQHVTQPGHFAKVECSGIGVEQFPPGYCWPEVHSASQLIPEATLPFVVTGGLTYEAQPIPYTGIPLADTALVPGDITSITADADTGLVIVTITVARASWAADALKGKWFIGDASGATTCAIRGSDATHLYLDNTLGAVPMQNFTVVEPSATFQTASVGPQGAGIEIADCTSFVSNGISWVCQDADPFSIALSIEKTLQPVFHLGYIDGISMVGCMQQCLTSAIVHSSKLIDVEASTWTPRRSIVLGCQAFNIGATPAFIARSTTFDGCQGSITSPPFGTNRGALGGVSWEFVNCEILNSNAPQGAIYAQSGRWAIQDTKISGTIGGDAILADGPQKLVLEHVTGAGNAGFGVRTDDGAHVEVDITTTVIGALGAYKNGAVALVAAWPGAPFNDSDAVTFSRVWEP